VLPTYYFADIAVELVKGESANWRNRFFPKKPRLHSQWGRWKRQNRHWGEITYFYQRWWGSSAPAVVARFSCKSAGLAFPSLIQRTWTCALPFSRDHVMASAELRWSDGFSTCATWDLMAFGDLGLV
jgi:hypothetical protein